MSDRRTLDIGLQYVPKKAFMTRGVGKHKEKLTSFEMALRKAGIAHLNLVRVSSIFPPHCRLISKSQGLSLVHPGQVTFVVMSENSTNEPHRLIAASVGIAIPSDPNLYGYLSEHHGFGQREKVAGDYAEDLAASMLATVLGVEFDPNASWDEKREIWRISGKIVKTKNITQTAVGDKDGLWTTVVAAVVLLP
ncbi:MAG: arginine decarboxylase, pyruvoyl-dependent [candidate division KSB1 bacterium]|nr:arginine decarboxylase, pyruvoyl-dependent [candidate division KSB1 bacterium]